MIKGVKARQRNPDCFGQSPVLMELYVLLALHNNTRTHRGPRKSHMNVHGKLYRVIHMSNYLQ